MEGIHPQCKEHPVHIQHSRARQNCHNKKLARHERAALYRKLTEGEKQACDTLQRLFDTLATKFRPQFNETIKSLQCRKLCRFEGESAEEWMGRLHVAAAECSYREVD